MSILEPATAIEDDNIRVNVLQNDTFPADVVLTATNGSNGTTDVRNGASEVAESHPLLFTMWMLTGTPEPFTRTITSESAQGTVTMTYTAVNDAPTITSSDSFSINEGTTSVGTVVGSDVDGDSLTYSISGTDAASFTINSSSGVLAFNSAPDYETKNSYTIIASVSDSNLTANQTISVSINNLNQ